MADAEDTEEIPVKKGWLWKGATGRATFGRKTWKMRYIISNSERLEYYATEPFDNPKGGVNWEDVTCIYENVSPATYGAATDTDAFYFGLRFKDDGKEYVLCFRTDRADDRDSWLSHFKSVKEEFDVLREDNDNLLHVQVKSSGILEKIRLKLRNAVSLKKQRFVKDGMDLDLAYIVPNVIAMGYPAEGREANYRNPMEQVIWFFDTYHKDRYRIYNLCSERSYPPSRFNGAFVRFPFDDHNAAPLELLLSICEDIHRFLCQSSRPDLVGPGAIQKPVDCLQKQPGNVVSIHCKAGKGRTGLVICCYLLYAGVCRTTEDALKLFGDRRTKDGKGVQIPSQKRYIKYFEELLYRYSGFIPTSHLIIHSLTLGTTPSFDADGGSDPYVVLRRRKADHKHRCMHQIEGCFKDQTEVILDTHLTNKISHINNVRNYDVLVSYDVGECGDVQICLYDEDISRNEYMCSFWVHAGFLDDSGRLSIPKMMLDDAVRDTSNKAFTEDFFVTLNYTVRLSDTLPVAPSMDIPALRMGSSRRLGSGSMGQAASGFAREGSAAGNERGSDDEDDI